MSGSTLASKDEVDPLIHKDYLDELADAYFLTWVEPQGSAGLASLRRPARLSADVDPGRIGRNPAC